MIVATLLPFAIGALTLALLLALYRCCAGRGSPTASWRSTRCTSTRSRC